MLGIDQTGDASLAARIARAVVQEIRRGRLTAGAQLPSSRALARMLGVHRNTAIRAYAELEREGWLETAPARGSFVATALPSLPITARGRGVPRLGYVLRPAPLARAPSPMPAAGQLALYGGHPDLSLPPFAELARAYRRALRRSSRRTMAYGDPRGEPRFIEAMRAHLSEQRGVVAPPGGLIVVRGSQMGLYLVGRALLRAGDQVAVEALGYRPAWGALRLCGADLHPVPVDEEGLRVELLERLCERHRLRAIYVTPHHQYPTTVTMSAARRLALLALAERRGIAIIEDDYDHEFHFDGPPVLPLASQDEAGVVVYLGTLSKVLAPGLRIGYVVAPRELIDALASLRMLIDRQGDHTLEHALADLLESGELGRHTWRARRAYLARRDALAAALAGMLPELRFRLPPGGLALWAEAAGSTDVDAWAARAAARGLLVETASRYTFDGRPRPALRLGFAGHAEPALIEAVRRLAAARPAPGGGRPAPRATRR